MATETQRSQVAIAGGPSDKARNKAFCSLHAHVFTFIGPHSPDFWESISQLHRQEATERHKCVCALLDFELLLLLKQYLLALGLHFFFSLFVLKMRKRQLTGYLGVSV